MNFPRIIPYPLHARERNSPGRDRRILQVKEARAVVYKQNLVGCVHGTLPSHYFRPWKLSFPICLWNQLPVTSSTGSPAGGSGPDLRMPRSFRKIRRFFLRVPRPTNESADFQFALRAPSLPFCLLQWVKYPGGKSDGLFRRRDGCVGFLECEK